VLGALGTPFAVVAVSEPSQGIAGLDLNGDGDAGDGVVAVLDMTTGAWTQSTADADPSGLDFAGTARVLPSDGATAAWLRREADSGTNLNGASGDADVGDALVAFVRPPAGPATHPVGGAALYPRFPTGRILASFTEAQHGPGGGLDLNGDLDAFDTVMGAIDTGSNGLVHYFPLAVVLGTPFPFSNTTGAFLVPEADQGVDYDADGDFVDVTVACVRTSAAPGQVAPDGKIGEFLPFFPARAVDPNAAFAVSEVAGVRNLGGYLSEQASGNVPFNADLDTTDFVPALFDVTNKVLRIPGGLPGVQIDAGAGAPVFFYEGHLAVFLTQEQGVDLNADLDGGADLRTVLWADDQAVPTTANLLVFPGMPAATLDGGAAARLSNGRLAFLVSEIANGRDLNADGDQFDRIFHLVDMTTNPPTVTATVLAPTGAGTFPPTGIAGPSGVLLRCVESLNGDLNADGDNLDVLCVYLPYAAPGTRVVLPNTGGEHAAVAGNTIAVTANEIMTGQDLNGDGDAVDVLFRAFDTSGNVLVTLPSVSNSVPASFDGSHWAFLRYEQTEGVDHSGDGDLFDFVLGVWSH
jgi:hypothetical protein